ncbi:MAG: hypothetical protein AAFU50_12245, partial [Pseudomonadota bacterium]
DAQRPACLGKALRCGVDQIGETTVDWKPKHIFVAPSWRTLTHTASSEPILFSYSDRPFQEKPGLFREDRGNHASCAVSHRRAPRIYDKGRIRPDCPAP